VSIADQKWIKPKDMKYWTSDTQDICAKLSRRIYRKLTTEPDIDLNRLNAELSMLKQANIKYTDDELNSMQQMCIHQDSTNEIKRIVKILFHPSKELKDKLQGCFGADRFCYNSAAKEINAYLDREARVLELRKQKVLSDEDDLFLSKYGDHKMMNWTDLRNHICGDDSKHQDKEIIKKLIKETSSNNCQSAIKYAHSNCKAMKTMFRKKHIKLMPRLGMKTKKNVRQISHFDGRKLHIFDTDNKGKELPVNDIEYSILEKFGDKCRFKIPSKNAKLFNDLFTESIGELSVLKDYDRYYLLVPRKKFCLRTNESNVIAAYDPGIKKFMSVIDTAGANYSIGIDMSSNINKLFNRIDAINNMDMTNDKARYRFKQKQLKKRLIAKISNYVTDYQKKTTKYLSLRYQAIIAPKLGVKSIAAGLPPNVNRLLYAQSHYKFWNRLADSCELHGSTILNAKEFFTSQTCTKCGHCHKDNCKDDRTFICSKCKYLVDRDINGAIGIMIRFLSKV